MNKISYFPGCSAHGTGREFDNSLKYVMKEIGVELVEVPDWNCCGATSAHVLNESLSLALPMRNLIQAESLNNKVMAIPCASCYSRHKVTKQKLDSDSKLKDRIQSLVADGGGGSVGKYNGTAEVKSMLQFLFEDIGTDQIKKAVKFPLTGLKIASYYGCLLTRPKSVTNFDSPEFPISMDRIMESLGGTATDFDHKTECCGASFSISKTEVVYQLTEKILDAAAESGADLIAVACPLCQANLDMRQSEIEEMKNKKYNLPVVYFTQLLALAFGVDRGKLEFHRHLVPIEPALVKIQTSQPAQSSVQTEKTH